MVQPDFALFISKASRFWVLVANCNEDIWFWRTAALSPTPAHLPALATIIASQNKRPDNFRHTSLSAVGKLLLHELALYPLPFSFSSYVFPFYSSLLSAWEKHHSAISQQPLIYLDCCAFSDSDVTRPSLLPHWLAAVADAIKEPYSRPFRLGNLASWRPTPGTIICQEDLNLWLDFWLRLLNPPRRFSRRSLLSIISSKALFHCDKGPLGIIKERLMKGPSLAHQSMCAAPSAYNYFSAVAPEPPLPLTPSAKEVMQDVIKQWIDMGFQVLRGSDRRKAVSLKFICRQLARWGENGYLADCEIDLTHFVLYVLRSNYVFWDLARIPATAFSPHGISLILAEWRSRLTSNCWLTRATAWAASTRLRQTGFSLDPDFWGLYYAAVRGERRVPVLMVLSATLPPGPDLDWVFVWAQKRHPKARALALLRYVLEFGGGSAWHYLRVPKLDSWLCVYAHALDQIRNGLLPDTILSPSSNWPCRLWLDEG